MRFALSVLPLIAVTLSLAGQTTLPRQGEPLVRVSVNLAQTDVVVTDSSGHPVRDLESRDFEIFEDGKKQTITNFSWVDVVVPPLNAVATPSSTRSITPPARVPRREDLHRAIVLMLDDAGTSTADLAAILPAMRRFVAEQIQPGDLAAVTASRGGMGIFERLTGDKNQLYAAIDRIGHRPGWLACDYVPPYVSKLNAETFGYVPGDFIFSSNFCQPANKNGYLRWAIEGLRTVPGRKAIVLFSHSFGLSPANAALANRADVVIYVLDPVGGEPSKIRAPGPMGVAGTAALAEQTGGFRKLRAPGRIGEDLGQVLDDMSGYYLLGYHPERGNPELKGSATDHSIQVRVLRPQLTVRARSMLSSETDSEAEKTPHTREEYLQNALFSPFVSGGLRLRLQPSYTASSPDPKTKRKGADLLLHLTIENPVGADDPNSLTIDTLVAVFGPDGVPIISNDKRWRIDNISPERAAVFRASGLRFRMQVELPQAGAYQVRAVVRNALSGDTGSAYAFLTIPDFDKSALTLATPVLGPSGWDEFEAGETVQFSCEVFGAAAPRMSGEIRLYRDTEPIGAPYPVTYEIKSGKRYLIGALPLASGLASGDYAIRLLMWKNEPSRPTASYWSDIAVKTASSR
jgi:VWFA-related protein